MIHKYYEITCDHCGCADFYTVSIAEAEKDARKNGWIITKSKNHFCDSECKYSYNDQIQVEKK